MLHKSTFGFTRCKMIATEKRKLHKKLGEPLQTLRCCCCCADR